MELIDNVRIQGIATITLRDVDTGETTTWHGPNAVMDVGLQLFHERMAGVTGASPLGNLALGSGTGAFPGGATGLYHEDYRKSITAASVSSTVAVYKTYLTTAQGNSAVIREIGLTNAAGSGAGVLISHIEVSPGVSKTSAKEALITIVQTLSRA